jgi:hypothetical protein
VAASAFRPYDLVVFGDGLELNDAEHDRTAAIIQLLKEGPRRTAVYGYVDLGKTQNLSIPENDRRDELWKAIGVAGSILYEAGRDFGVTRGRRNAVVQFLHARGLRAFLNAFEPDDLFSAGHLLGKDDAFLLESFQVRLGRFDDSPASAARIARAVAARDRVGCRLFAVTTTSATEPYRPEMFAYAWWAAALWGVDGFGWGEPEFSSSTNALPWKPRLAEEQLLGQRFTSPPAQNSRGYSRRTDRGNVVIDTLTHTAQFVAAAGR